MRDRVGTRINGYGVGIFRELKNPMRSVGQSWKPALHIMKLTF